MQRRKFIAGVGSLAAAGAAGIGTGAFSSMSASRSADVNVVNDSDGLVALRVGDTIDSDVIRQNQNGELAIDFTADGNAGGVNVNSRYQVGVFTEVGWAGQQAVDAGALETNGPQGGPTPAFLVVNQDTDKHPVTIEYEADASDVGGSELFMQFTPGIGGNTQQGKSWEEVSGTNNSFSYTADSDGIHLGPGEAIAAVMMVDTRDGGTADDLTGTLTVSAD